MYKTDFFQHIRVILERSFEHFIRVKKRCVFDGSNPLVSISSSRVRSCLPLRNFITWTFVTSQLPALLCCEALGCLAAVAETLQWPRLWWWVRAQSWQLLPSLSPWSTSSLALYQQLNVSSGLVSFVKVAY